MSQKIENKEQTNTFKENKNKTLELDELQQLTKQM